KIKRDSENQTGQLDSSEFFSSFSLLPRTATRQRVTPCEGLLHCVQPLLVPKGTALVDAPEDRRFLGLRLRAIHPCPPVCSTHRRMLFQNHLKLGGQLRLSAA